MDPHEHNQPPPMMTVPGGAPLPYDSTQYPIPPSVEGVQSASQSSGSQLAQQQLAYESLQHRRVLQQRLNAFWAVQTQEIEKVFEFRNYSLPLARIKRIMKADEDVRMISAEAPVLFSKACELFILELTLRAWSHAEENKRRTLQKCDIGAAITRTEPFDFMADLVPKEDNAKDEAVSTIPKGDGGGVSTAPGPGNAPPPLSPLPFRYMPPQHLGQVGGTPPGMIMGPPMMGPMGPRGMMMMDPMMDQMGPSGMIMGPPLMDPAMYSVQQPPMPFAPHQMWEQQLPPDQMLQPPMPFMPPQMLDQQLPPDQTSQPPMPFVPHQMWGQQLPPDQMPQPPMPFMPHQMWDQQLLPDQNQMWDQQQPLDQYPQFLDQYPQPHQMSEQQQLPDQKPQPPPDR